MAKHTKNATLNPVSTAENESLIPQWSHASSAQLSTVRNENNQNDAGENTSRWHTSRTRYQAEAACRPLSGASGMGMSSSECMDQRELARKRVVLRREMRVDEEVKSVVVEVAVEEKTRECVILSCLRLPRLSSVPTSPSFLLSAPPGPPGSVLALRLG